MDSGDADPACRDGYKVSAVDGSEQEGVDKGGDDGEGDGKRSSLHPPAVNCVMPGERPKSLGRKVTWNDVNGNKLVEVLEFYPRLVFLTISSTVLDSLTVSLCLFFCLVLY